MACACAVFARACVREVTRARVCVRVRASACACACAQTPIGVWRRCERSCALTRSAIASASGSVCAKSTSTRRARATSALPPAPHA
eukprot:1123346-Pleurochrysis_carterae.AAC.1